MRAEASALLPGPRQRRHRVRAGLGLGKSYLIDWQVYRHLLADQELMGELTAVTGQASRLSDHPDGIADPPLRALDVLLWMTAPADLPGRRRRT